MIYNPLLFTVQSSFFNLFPNYPKLDQKNTRVFSIQLSVNYYFVISTLIIFLAVNSFYKRQARTNENLLWKQESISWLWLCFLVVLTLFPRFTPDYSQLQWSDPRCAFQTGASVLFVFLMHSRINVTSWTQFNKTLSCFRQFCWE